MLARFRFLMNRLREKLWIRPLLMALLSVIGAFFAKVVEALPVAKHIPAVSIESVETLLITLTGSMLAVATFAVGAMVSSFSSASSSATPRTFPLVVSDDMSQNALSIFIGAFIFGLVSIVFVKNDFYDDSGPSVVLLLTAITMSVVIITFVRWVDGIARLGRLGTTIDKTVSVTERALLSRRRAPHMGGARPSAATAAGEPIRASTVGYVQRVNIGALQEYAQTRGLLIAVHALPGAFVAHDRILAKVTRVANRAAIGEPRSDEDGPFDSAKIEKAFIIGPRRTFDEDPRFGLVVLSEIAGRALSPAVNDPGTAIDITNSLVRLFTAWGRPLDDDERCPVQYDRVEIPPLAARDLFDDAFTAIARDGANSIEVATRLQKALHTLASIGDPEIRQAAIVHSSLALERAEHAMTLPADIEAIRALAAFARAR